MAIKISGNVIENCKIAISLPDDALANLRGLTEEELFRGGYIYVGPDGVMRWSNEEEYAEHLRAMNESRKRNAG